jgi:DNA-binding winged helix-turn-helix (wHTH) protein/tetratricopeptide (TPR) repeat protein
VVRYRFGEYMLDTQQYALWDQHAWTPLRPKIFAVLLYLIQQRDRVVSKAELLEHVWPEQWIGDGSLNACLMAVRKVLGDTGQTQRYIQTLRGHGYRFVARVHADHEAAAVPAAPLAPGGPSVARAEAEHRPLTVLHASLVDASRLAEQLDPETFREIVQAYHQTCRTVMTRFTGYVAQYHPARVCVYFGYPQAHDRAAEHAVRAGQALLTAWEPLQAHLAAAMRHLLALAVGIDTGTVVVDAAQQPPLALGQTLQRAELLQSWATPGTVVLSAATHRLVAGVLPCVALGQHHLPGLTQPLSIYQALSAPDPQTGLDLPPASGLTPLVGREAEMALLLARWRQAKGGMGQVVVLSGEAGIGKSRLVATLHAQIAPEPHVVLAGRCTAYDQPIAWAPLTQALQRFLGWQPQASAPEQHGRLVQVAQQYGLPLETALPALALVLGGERSEASSVLPLSDPQQQHQQMLTVLLALLTAMAHRQPLVWILEDLHWSDPSTLAWLAALVDAGPIVPIYTIVTCRPPFPLAWLGRAHVTPLVLSRLSPAQAAVVVQHVAGNATLPQALQEHIVKHADGVPLFLEELTKTALESDAVPVDSATLPLPIPTTLHDSLMARLDRLDTAKHLAQVGAVIGRTFSYPLLRALTALEDTTLQADLARLVAAELVYQQGLPPQATYVFKHALIRDAAYQSMLRRTRQQLHARVLQVCTAEATPVANLPPALLAQHATQAELWPQAVAYWQQAGTQALQQGAYPEALQHLQQGFAGLDSLPPGPARLRVEVELSLALTPVLLIMHGAGAPEVERLTTRAYALAQQLEQTPAVLPALRDLHYIAWTQGQLQTAQELAERLLALAQSHPDPVVPLEASLAMGTTLWSSGQCRRALQALEQRLRARDPRQPLAVQRVPHPELACLLYSALVLWYLGYPEQAQQRVQIGLEYAAQLAQPYHLAWGQQVGAMFYRLGHQRSQAEALTMALVQTATAHGMGLAVMAGQLLQDWALAETPLEPFTHYQPRLAAYRTRNGPLGLAQHLLWLTEAYSRGGQTNEGLQALTAAEHLVAYTGEQLVQTELLRMRGALLSCEDALQQALALARRQEAKMLELRAAVSLGRLWQHQGLRDRAHALVGPVYARFTEGWHTADLRHARVFLGELA